MTRRCDRPRRCRTASATAVAAALALLLLCACGGPVARQGASPPIASVAPVAVDDGYLPQGSAFLRSGLPIGGRFVDAAHGFVLLTRCEHFASPRAAECRTTLMATDDAGATVRARPPLPADQPSRGQFTLDVFDAQHLVLTESPPWETPSTPPPPRPTLAGPPSKAVVGTAGAPPPDPDDTARPPLTGVEPPVVEPRRWASSDGGFGWHAVDASCGETGSIPRGAQLEAHREPLSSATPGTLPALAYAIAPDGTCDTLADSPEDLLTDHGSAVLPQLGTSVGGSYFLPTQSGYQRSESVSTDQGRSWHPVAVPDKLQILRVIGSRATKIYAEALDDTTNSVTLLASGDGGLHWTATPDIASAVANQATVAMLANATPFLAADGQLSGANNGSAHPLPAGARILVGLDHAIIAISGDPSAPHAYLTVDGTDWKAVPLYGS